MRESVRWLLGVTIGAFIVGVPFAYYRATYAHAKRLREVADGKVYRSGQLTANGFREAFDRFQIKTVVNLQEDNRDPFIPESWQQPPSIRESAVCADNGVNYIMLDGGVLDEPMGEADAVRPIVIDEFLAILDNPANYPILFHCKAGLHRTGLMTAIYRMEFEGRTKADVVRELRANGFGANANETNAYLDQYISKYEIGLRNGKRSPAPNVVTEGGR